MASNNTAERQRTIRAVNGDRSGVDCTALIEPILLSGFHAENDTFVGNGNHCNAREISQRLITFNLKRVDRCHLHQCVQIDAGCGR